MPDLPGSDDDERSDDTPSVLGAAAPITVERERRRKSAPSSGDDGGSRRQRWRPRGIGGKVLAGAAVLLVLALVPSVTSGMEKTPRDRVGISYGGGPVEGTHFQRIVQPGSNLFWNGFFDDLYLYPADQQNYILSKGEGSEGAVAAPSKDRVQVVYQVAVYYKLNTDLLQTFHEQLGLKYQAYTPAGWDRLIRDTLRQQIENALQEETRRSDVADLYGDAELLIGIQDRVQATLSERLRAALGDAFFCSPTYKPGGECGDPTFVIKAIEIPESVAAAYEGNRTSQVEIRTKQNEVMQREAEAQGIQAISDALAAAGDDYVLLKAIESGKISFWVLPDDAGVTLAAPDAGGGVPTPPTTTTTTPPGG